MTLAYCRQRAAALAALLALAMTGRSEGAVKTETIAYKVGSVTCKGHLAWDDAVAGTRPGVLVVHEWWGLNDYARGRAEQLAAEGYVALAVDMYGDGKVAEHPADAGKFMSEVSQNVQEWRRRAAEGLQVLTSRPECDPRRVAAIGYCFGGATALQLAYSGADLKAVATFHSALPIPTAAEAKQIKASIQINHGAQDGFINEATIQEFRRALDAAKVDWTMRYYSGAVHGFTVKGAESRGVPGLKYDAHADERSWRSMLDLFREQGLTVAR